MIQELKTNKNLWRKCNENRVQYEIGVVVMNKVHDEAIELTKDVELENFAKQVHKKLGIGDRDCTTGLLLFVAMEKRFLHFSTGSGIMNILPNEFLSAVASEMQQILRRDDINDVDAAIVSGVFRVISQIKNPSLFGRNLLRYNLILHTHIQTSPPKW